METEMPQQLELAQQQLTRFFVLNSVHDALDSNLVTTGPVLCGGDDAKGAIADSIQDLVLTLEVCELLELRSGA